MENESLNNRPIAELVSFPNSDFVKINHGAGWSPTKLGGCSGVIVYFPPGKVMYLHSPKTMVSEIEHFPWASHLQFRWCLMSLSPRYFTTGRDHYWVEERKTSFQSGWQSEFDDSSWTELSGYLKGRFKDVGRKKLFCLQRIVVQYLSESSTYNNGNVGVGVRDFTIENRMDPPVCRVTVKARCKNWTANSCVCVCVSLTLLLRITAVVATTIFASGGYVKNCEWNKALPPEKSQTCATCSVPRSLFGTLQPKRRSTNTWLAVTILRSM